MDIRKLFILSVGLISLILIYTFFSSGGGEKKRKKLSADQLTLLLGGGSSSSENNSDKKGFRKNPNSSVFDEGDFMNVGIDKNYEDDTSANNPKGEAPINPQTGKPYDDETMEQFDKLRLYFPGNDLIPKRMTPEDKQAKDNAAKEMARIAMALQGSRASQNDVIYYYGAQEKVLNDRVEIIEYLIDAQKEDNSFNKDNQIQFDKILDGAKEQLKILDTQKEEALKKITN
jgi:hypothetical protein